jgi:hypothetical protein
MVHEAQFGGTPQDERNFANSVSEWMADTAETLKALAIIDAPDQLEADLCEREYGWANKKGCAVKILEDKDAFKKRLKRSPDDGDGFLLACASEFLFSSNPLAGITTPIFGISGWNPKM